MNFPLQSGEPVVDPVSAFDMFLKHRVDLNYKSVAKEISKPPFFWLLKSSGHQSLPCLFDLRFL